MGFSGTAFCHIGGNAMAAAIKLRSTPCCASGCVADTGVGFSVKNSKAQSFLQVCGSVGVGGNLCHAWSCKGRFGSGQTVPLPNQGMKLPVLFSGCQQWCQCLCQCCNNSLDL